MQYWIVKSGTKEVISGPFETQDEANKEMARFPVGGDAKSVTQGNYLGNGLIEAVQSGMTFKIDWDGESIVHVEYVRNGKVGLIRLNRPKTANGQPIRPEDKIEMSVKEFEAEAKPVNYNPRTKKFESIYDLEKAKEELQYALQDLRDAKAAGEDKEVIKELQDEVKRCREVLNSLSESASFEKDMDENKPVIVRGVKGMKSTPFTKKFKNMAAYEKWADSEAAENFEVYEVMNESAYEGETKDAIVSLKSKGLLDKSSKEMREYLEYEGFSKQAIDGAISWAAAKFESVSPQDQANSLLNTWFNDPSPSAWGSKSFVVSKLAKSMGVSLKVAAELHKNWANLNEAASFDFSTTNDADILKVSAALEKAGIPFEVEENGESFVVKVLDSRDQLVASELIGDTMKESNSGLISVFYNGKLVKEFKGNEEDLKKTREEYYPKSDLYSVFFKKLTTESSGFSEGEEVKVVGNVSGKGKVGIIRDMAPSGHFYVVKFSDGTSSSYHESNLVAYEGDDEDLDESKDYSNVVSQHEHRNKRAEVYANSDGSYKVKFYRKGELLATTPFDSKEEAQSEAKAWVAGGVNESESRRIGIEHHSDGTRVISTYWDGRNLAKFIHPEQYNEVEEGGWAYSDGDEPNNAVNSIEDFIGLSLHLIQQEGGELYINGKQAHAKNIDQTSGSPVSIGELQFESGSEAKAWVAGGVNESAQLSPFERAGLNPVYSEDGKKATVKIFSECDMEKFNKVVEAYLNTYIESIEYKIEESDDNCLYVIEVKLVQTPETKGDPETMMKELKTK